MAWLLRRFIGFAVVFLVLGMIERLFAARPEQKVFRKGYRTDLLHFLFSGGLTQVALVLVIAPLAILTYLLVPEAPKLWVASLPWPAQFLMALVITDFVGYWRHRAAHEIPFLWRFHAVHHSSEHMDWLASVRIHPLDIVLARAAVFVPLFALGFSRETFGGYLVFLQLMGLLFHTNVHWDFGPLRKVISSPAFHHWHHAVDPIDKNYAGQFPLWDLLFGTFHLPEGELPEDYGTRRPVPEAYLDHMLHPFRGAAEEAGYAAPVGVESLPTIAA